MSRSTVLQVNQFRPEHAMKRTSAGRPDEFDTPSKTSENREDWSSADEGVASPILVLIIACLIFALLVLRTPDTVVLAADQILLMPGWGP